ncbi:MAG: hypothetical protein GYA36_18250 [Veillonellaceae bacterium]|nr:hypothetical protein [Veillonellaceae bacterium]
MYMNLLKNHLTSLLLLPALVIMLLIDMVLIDKCILVRDYNNLMSLLQETRYSAIYDNRTLTIRFAGHTAVLADKDGVTLTSLFIPTLTQVNYNTTKGPNQIIFDARCGVTSPYNIHIHGGDFTLRSWFGDERGIWVHCTGFASEGWMTEEAKADAISAR